MAPLTGRTGKAGQAARRGVRLTGILRRGGCVHELQGVQQVTDTLQSLLSVQGVWTEHASPPVPDHALLSAVDAYVKARWRKPPPRPVRDNVGLFSLADEARASRVFSREADLTWEPSRYHDPPMRTSPEPFAAFVMKLIRDRNLSEVGVYTKARLDKRQFAKIRNGACPTGDPYTPSKETALALALALELSLDEAGVLLRKAGLALSDAIKRDVIVSYLLENRRYSVDEANVVLYANRCPLLGTQNR